jgi:hypothetical protein
MRTKRWPNRTTVVISACICFILTTGFLDAALAATHYVSTTGSASWANSTNISTPTNIATAFANAAAGDLVYFRGGTYTFPQAAGYEFGAYKIAHGGTSDNNRVVFQAYTGETPVFRGSWVDYGNQMANMLDNGGNSYITIDGFTFEAFSGSTRYTPELRIYSNGSSNATKSVNIVIQNCTFIGTTVTLQDNHHMIWLDAISYVTIKNNTFRDMIAYSGNSDYAGIACIMSYGGYDGTWANHITIENNLIYNSSVAVYTKLQASDFTIRNNYFHDVESGVVFGSTYGNNHQVYNNVLGPIRRLTANTSRPLYGINMPGNSGTGGDGNIFYNNTIYGDDTQAGGTGGIHGRGTNLQIYNNIIKLSIVGSGDPAGISYIYADGSFQSYDHNQFGNSPFYLHVASTDFSTIAGLQAANVTTDTNNVCSSQRPCGNLASNPLFKNTSGNFSTLADFELASNSPCKGTGRNGTDMGANISLVGVTGTGSGSGKKTSNAPGKLR